MELIITEKPSSAKKIAEALSDDPAKEQKKRGVKYYEITHEGRPVTVVSAVGHLYTVAEKKKEKGWTYPVFDIEWVPSHTKGKDAAFTKKYLDVIKSFAKKADGITIATDFDIEGEVIGYTTMHYACGRDDAQRMKFSTVTTEDLQASYEQKMPSIAWGQARAGVTRHELDWYYGINLSRALTLAVKQTGRFKILSSGRVQTPALKILAEKEKEIKAFEAEPYWQIELHTDKLTAQHETDKFWKEEEARKAESAVTKEAAVEDVQTRKRKSAPPNPFDLTTLQTEAYRSLGIKPKETLQHAQDLYSAGYISYPRTSSQQLPKNIGYKKILTQLSKQTDYEELAGKLLGQSTLKPNNGKKTDPAHPAIYPTGVKPSTKRARAKKIYDLIVRRFMATFADEAERETLTITVESGGERFHAKGTRTTYAGWHEYYGPHVKLKEEEMPKVDKGEKLKVESVEVLEKETQPPRRYTPSSVIKELEKRGLGTKATRADIIENLYNRGYVAEDSIEVTELGMRTIETLEQYVPRIIDEEFTHQLEEELQQIREEKATPEEVLEHAKTHLLSVLDEIKKHEKKIGKELIEAQDETREKQTNLGPSPKKEEGTLQIKRSKWGFFVGSSEYPDCKSTWSLPKGYVSPARKICPWCEYPLIDIKAKKRGKRVYCFNLECESKEVAKEDELKLAEHEGKPCPRCKEGDLVLRKSVFGSFIGCSRYPKCRYSEPLTSIWESEREKVKDAEPIDT